jgi:hypothetical protein
MSLVKVFACGLVSLLPAMAYAELDCVVPTREEGYDAKQRGAAELQRAARAAAEIVQKNVTFTAGNKPVRVRTTISYYGWDRLAASVVTTAYNEKAWVGGGCKISKFADRGGGLSDGTIAIFLNDPDSLLGGRYGDVELAANHAPTLLGRFAGFPTYAAGGNPQNERLLLTKQGYVPWVPVTVGELLAWRERDLKKREQDYQGASQDSSNDFNEAKIEEIYLEMKKVNAAEAEKGRAQMLASLAKMRAAQARDAGATTRAMSEQRRGFDAYRASFTPAQLASPATISNATTRDGIVRVDDPSGSALVRVDPGFPRRDRRRIHVITVSIAKGPKTDPEYDWYQASLEALDYKAIAKLLDP